MKRKTRMQMRNELQFTIIEEHVRLSQELITFIKRGVYPKSTKVRRADVERVAMTVGIPTVQKMCYVEFAKKLAEITETSK